MFFDIICCVDMNNGFGYFNKDNKIFNLPWKNINDMNYFTKKTKYTNNPLKKNIILMGKNTFLSITRILPERMNIVISKDKLEVAGLTTIRKFDDVFKYYSDKIENIFVIGGVKLIESVLNHPRLRYIYINKINKVYNCNIYLSNIIENKQFKIINNENSNNINYYKLENTLYSDEYQYLKLLKKVLYKGDKRQTRNATTYSLFSNSLKFDLDDKFPILTTKKVFFRGIVEELIWFLKGETNSKILEKKKVNIWKGNSSKEFLEKVDLNYVEGDIGNMYGFQWKHFGADYYGYDKSYDRKGYNQLDYILNTLIEDPFSRRIIMTTFDPSQVNKGVLYPCHGLITQFYVNQEDGIRYLSCHMYQRSADMFLGVPFNITSYSLLCYLICEILNNISEFKYKPKELTISFGDLHIYEIHREAVLKQIDRLPFEYPTLKFNKKIENFNDLKYEDIELNNYFYHPSIKAEMVS